MSEIIIELTSDFKGQYPNVPFAAGVDAEGFQSEPNPFFVTLPIARVGVKSRNGREFNRAAVERIVSQINDKKPEGNIGHIPVEKRSTHYEMPKLRWLGAVLDADGTAWGKAWIPSYASDVREFFRDAKRSNARVGTSIYGKEGEAGLADMVLEQIDLGHPDRLGVLEVGAIPQITSELNDENKEADNMAEKEVLAELLTSKDAVIAELQTKVNASETLVSELQSKAAIADAVIAELGADPVTTAKGLIAELVDLKKAKLANEIDDVIAELVKVPQLRGIAKKEVAHVKSADEARTVISEFMGTDEYQDIAKALVLKASGGRAVVTEFNHEAKIDESASALAKARAEWGF